jgi:hypothetical protein
MTAERISIRVITDVASTTGYQAGQVVGSFAVTPEPVREGLYAPEGITVVHFGGQPAPCCTLIGYGLTHGAPAPVLPSDGETFVMDPFGGSGVPCGANPGQFTYAPSWAAAGGSRNAVPTLGTALPVAFAAGDGAPLVDLHVGIVACEPFYTDLTGAQLMVQVMFRRLASIADIPAMFCIPPTPPEETS